MFTHERADDFGPFDGKIWLNSASEGPLPKVAVSALQQAIGWKINPALLTNQKFAEIPLRLKRSLAKLLNADPLDIILGNSATYGVHLLAQSFPFEKWDEILLMRNDFPTDILPWLVLEPKGIKVRQLSPQQPVITPQELENAITPATRLVCLPHVHTFSGQVIDIQKIGEICQARGIVFVLNTSQSLGYFPIDLSRLPVDALTSAGFKWLCGPYGTGFCWIRKSLRERLHNQQAFWVNVMTDEQLGSTEALSFVPQNSSRAFDVFGTANFFNFVPFTASIDYFLEIGIEHVSRMIDERVVGFIDGLNKEKYFLVSREEQGQRSALIVFSRRDREKNNEIFKFLLEQEIYIAKWKGLLRVSPHVFNTPEDIQKLLNILNSFS